MNYKEFLGSAAGYFFTKEAVDQLWRSGEVQSPYVMGVIIHRAYVRSVSAEIAGFVRDALAYEKKNQRPGTTKEILKTTSGKSSSDGATYGTIIGLLTRERVHGDYRYTVTRRGREFIENGLKIPRQFALVERYLFGLSHETISFQEAMGRSSSRKTFTGKIAAAFRPLNYRGQ